MKHRVIALSKKEFKQLLRDRRFLFVIFFLPAFLLVIFGYAVNFDVKDIQLAVYDLDNSKISRELSESFTSSSYFKLVEYLKNGDEVNSALDNKEAQVVLVIPNGFSEKIFSRGEEVKIQFLIDGVDGNTANIIQNYVNAQTNSFNRKIRTAVIKRYGGHYVPQVKLDPLFWYNPDLQTTKFLIPGLMAMILMVTSVIAVALSLVREKERGTIEQINVSSLTNVELILGKAIPYVIVSLIDAFLVILAGYILFDVAIKGSILLLLLSTVIFLMAAIGLGIFVSVIADSQQVAFMIATFSSLLPSLILSGFIFPIESMPYIIQIFTNITPAKFYIVALRAIMLRGVGIEAFWPELIYLFLFFFLFMTFSAVLWKKKEYSL